MRVGFPSWGGRAPRVWLASLVVGLVAQACLPALPEANPEVVAGACGNEGESCCGEGAPACGARLFCNLPSGRCVSTGPRQCISDDQCEAGQACCVSGLIGSCAEVGQGLACPQADLQLEMRREELGLALETRTFDPMSPEGACAIEKQCIGGYGERLLLHFSATVRNVGDADLLFGSSSAAPFVQAACDGQPYFAKYLTYSLVDSEGGIRASGQRQARCASASASGFDCQFNGLERGSAQIYPGRPLDVLYDNQYIAAGFSSEEFVPVPAPDEVCQWLDVTDVAPGNYLLRAQVNAEGLLAESSPYNNRIEVPVTLPSRADSTQTCPTDDGARLLGYAAARECGWVALGPAASCTPGAGVELRCAACLGGPLLRVCEGALPCSFDSALTWTFPSEFRPGQCPYTGFECPESGRYRVYRAPPGAGSSARMSCTLQATPL